jgi:hypothetical protein
MKIGEIGTFKDLRVGDYFDLTYDSYFYRQKVKGGMDIARWKGSNEEFDKPLVTIPELPVRKISKKEAYS